MKLPEIKIIEGEVANLTVFDLEKEWTFSLSDIRSKSSNTPFIGFEMKGMVLGAINNDHSYWREMT
jgi:dihydroorotase